jgi:hypothetical protein
MSATKTKKDQGDGPDETVGVEAMQAVSHFTVAERAARGKATRDEISRQVHGESKPAPGRADPVELLEKQAETRVTELVPIRYGRMLVSPFTFFRGAAFVMAADLAGMPRMGVASPVLRRRAPLELRRLRGAGPAARVRHQRHLCRPERTRLRHTAGGRLRPDRCPVGALISGDRTAYTTTGRRRHVNAAR